MMSYKQVEDLVIPSHLYSIKKEHTCYLIFLNNTKVGMVQVDSRFPDELENLFLQSWAIRINPDNMLNNFLVLENAGFTAVTNETLIIPRVFFWVPSLLKGIKEKE